jgi:hypothetical protein
VQFSSSFPNRKRNAGTGFRIISIALPLIIFHIGSLLHAILSLLAPNTISIIQFSNNLFSSLEVKYQDL